LALAAGVHNFLHSSQQGIVLLTPAIIPVIFFYVKYSFAAVEFLQKTWHDGMEIK
jgi:hypothetical protein